MRGTQASESSALRVQLPWRGPVSQKFAPLVESALDRFLQMEVLNQLYESVRAGSATRNFFDAALQCLNVRYDVSSADLSRIPAAGSVVVVANHPFGAIEGLLLASLLRRIRPDVRILANFLLAAISEIREVSFLVDPFRRAESPQMNAPVLRQAMEWLSSGGMLGVFPAGEVSHLDLWQRAVLDPAWSDTTSRMARKSGAPVLPVYFHGANGPAFQMLGLVHPLLRTALLTRELLNKRNHVFDVRVGTLIPANRLAQFDDDSSLTSYLRHRTYLLEHRRTAAVVPGNAYMGPRPCDQAASSARASWPPVASAGNSKHLAAEINSLSAEHTLVTSGPLRVLLARAAEIPHAFREIARLRELTFRAVGEGSGKPLDMDSFDPHYLHLFIWNDDRQELAGAYRLGCTDQLLAQFGVGGLYTSTVFRFQPRLLHHLNPGLELGRSFVCADYQRSFSALMLLWKGIGRFLVQNPQYRFLFGPVSISNEYQAFSQHLMVEFLRKKHALPQLARWVKPRLPFRPRHVRAKDAPSAAAIVESMDELNAWVAEIEADGKGVPILLRQYLRLGGKVLAFNVDPNFSNVVDGLILVDVMHTDGIVLERYLGREGVKTFRAFHQHALPL